MRTVTPTQVGRLFMLGGAVGLLLVLFLDWREVLVRAGPVEVVSGSSGWNGWGWAAGVFALALVVLVARRLAGADPDPEAGSSAVAALLASAACACTVLAAVTGSVDVSVGTAVGVDTERVLWPAYAAIACAAVAVAGALPALVARPAGRLGRPTPHGA